MLNLISKLSILSKFGAIKLKLLRLLLLSILKLFIYFIEGKLSFCGFNIENSSFTFSSFSRVISGKVGVFFIIGSSLPNVNRAHSFKLGRFIFSIFDNQIDFAFVKFGTLKTIGVVLLLDCWMLFSSFKFKQLKSWTLVNVIVFEKFVIEFKLIDS